MPKLKVRRVFDNPTAGTHETTILSIKEIGATESQFVDKAGNKPMRDTLSIMFRLDDQSMEDGTPVEYEWKPTAAIAPAAPKKNIRATSLYKFLKALSVDPVIDQEIELSDFEGRKLLVRFSGTDSKTSITEFPKDRGIEVTKVEMEDILDEVTPARMHRWEEAEGRHVSDLKEVIETIEKFQDDYDVEIRALKQGGFALKFVRREL